MTPEDVAAIRAESLDDEAGGTYCSPRRVLALCAALEAAWAEREEDKADIESLSDDVKALRLESAQLRERAERAEATAHYDYKQQAERAEQDAEYQRRQVERVARQLIEANKRAERAEAQRDRIRALWREVVTRAERAEAERLRLYNECIDMSAALDRVRALCDDDLQWRSVRSIRAALDGPSPAAHDHGPRVVAEQSCAECWPAAGGSTEEGP